MARENDPRRRPRLDDVATAAGVSTATASLVLRGVAGPSAQTRQRVVEAATKLAYRPDRAASALASRRSRLIGLVIDISQPFHAQLVQDFHAVVHGLDYNLVLSTVTPEHDELHATETLLDSRCEAVVVLAPAVAVDHLGLLAKQLPIVVLGHPFGAAGVDVVRTDDMLGFELAVGHLASWGHRRISFIDGGSDPASAVRVEAYMQAMERHRLTEHIQLVSGGDSESAGAAAAARLIQSEVLPTAIVTFNDRCAVGALDAFRRNHIDVPGALSVIGYDDSPLARLGHINLTTISQDTGELARVAIAQIIERRDGTRGHNADVLVPPRLSIRTTTSTAPTPAPPPDSMGAEPVPIRRAPHVPA